MKFCSVASVWFLVCCLANVPPARAGGPASGSKVQKLDAAALARLIDDHIEKRLKAERIPSSPRTDDAEFLRRVYLEDRKSTRLNSSHLGISYAVFCLK